MMKGIALQGLVVVLCLAAVVVIKMLHLPGIVTALLLIVVAAVMIYGLAVGFSKKNKPDENPST